MRERARFGEGRVAVVVEDDEAVSVLVQRLLEEERFTVHAAATVEGGGDLCDRVRPDVVVTDKQLPDGTGLELVRRMAEGGADFPFVMMTAFADVDSAVEAMHLNIADYVVKPFHGRDLMRRVQRALEVSILKRRNRELMEHLRRQNRELEASVVLDPLTGLFNHAYLMDRLETEIASHRRNGQPLSLVFVDVDDLKVLNDSLGHAAGDWVLQVVARLLGGKGMAHSPLRAGDIAARYGGDEMALVLPCTPRVGAATKAERVRAHIVSEQRQQMPGVQGPVTVSLGVAEFPSDGNTRAELLHAADTALYAAKALGGNRVVSYSSGLASLGRDHSFVDSAEARLVLALDRTIEGRSLGFAYQPIVQADTLQVTAYEGLCRPAENTFRSPTELFACAERAGRIWEVGRIVRELVVAPMERMPAGCNLFVNLHPYELFDPSLLDGNAVLDRWASRVVLEVTEVGAMRDHRRMVDALKRLRGRGFQIALDDLGSGYSGLNALADLPADYVKLDIGLVRSVATDEKSRRLVRHIVEFAADERIRVIAEGIENDDQREALTTLGCPLLQGYYFGRPAPAFTNGA